MRHSLNESIISLPTSNDYILWVYINYACFYSCVLYNLYSL